MTTDVMKEVLEKLNAILRRKGRKILLLMDNVPCHSHNLADTFSNITIKFLPKNATSMTQPLDAGIIANWKVKYEKKLLRIVCSRVDEKRILAKSSNWLMFPWQSSGGSRRGMKCPDTRLSSASKNETLPRRNR